MKRLIFALALLLLPGCHSPEELQTLREKTSAIEKKISEAHTASVAIREYKNRLHRLQEEKRKLEQEIAELERGHSPKKSK